MGMSRGTFRQYLATQIAYIVCFSYGLAIGWPSPALPVLQSSSSPLGVPLSVESASWVAAVMCLVAVPATPFFTFLHGHLGSRTTALGVAVPMAASWFLLAFATTETELYLGRVMVGFAAAGAFALCSIYVRDIATDAIRGTLTALVMTYVTAGILCIYILGWLASYRVAALVSAAGPILFAAGFLTLPETPWFLLARGKTEEARQSLLWFRDSDDVEEELSSISTRIKIQRQLAEHEPVGLLDLFATRANRKAFLIAMVVCTNQHASGVFAMLTYTETIFREAGSSIEPSLSSIVVGAVLCAANYVSSLLVDRAGRRCLLLVSDVCVAAASAVLGAYFYAKNVHGADMVSHLGWLPLVCLSVFVVGISLGLYPVPYVLLAELFAPRIRAMASSIGIAVTWLLPFVMAKFFPSMVAALGEHGCYWFFSGCCIAGTIFILVAVPETKGRSLDDIQRELQGD